MATPQPSRERISKQTFLGMCLEEIAELAIQGSSLAFERSPTPPDGLISPDFLRTESPAAFVAVTSTPTRNTFQKKKWRYVHEVFSNKQWHSAISPLAINVQLSLPGALQPLDRGILNSIFDVEIAPSAATLQSAIVLLQGAFTRTQSAAKAVEQLQNHRHITALVEDIRTGLSRALSSPPRQRIDLWSLVASNQSQETARRDISVLKNEDQSYLRHVCFGLLLLSDDEIRKTLLAIASGKALPQSSADLLKMAGVPIRPRLGGYAPDTDIFQRTIQAGFSVPTIATLCSEIRGAGEVKHILEDLRSDVQIDVWAKRLLPLFKSGKQVEYAKRVLADFKKATRRDNTSRLAILDYSLLFADMSITDIDKMLANRFGDLGAANRVQCMISERCQGRYSFSDDDTLKTARYVWQILKEDTDITSVSSATAVARAIQQRKKSLYGLGGELNPTEMLFQGICKSAGLDISRDNLPCLFSDCGLTGRGSKVERIYIIRKGEKVAYVKALSGYKGGFEHKAEELAGRSWVLRYRLNSKAYRRDNTRLVFVYEGEWDQSSLTMLMKAGWNCVIRLADMLRMDHGQVDHFLLGDDVA